MENNQRGRAAGAAGTTTQKLGEADVLNLVLDYLATKGFVEAERTLRQSVSASDGSPKHSSNQQTGEVTVQPVDTHGASQLVHVTNVPSASIKVKWRSVMILMVMS